MDMKLKKLIDEGETLNSIAEAVASQISNDLTVNLSSPSWARFRAPLKKHFFNFINAFQQFYPYVLSLDTLDKDWNDGLKYVLSDPWPSPAVLLLEINRKLNSEYEDEARALLDNALIYAIACSMKSVIPQIYMQTKTGPYGAPPARFTDSEYRAFVEKGQPLLATFVSSKNKLLGSLILTILGYMIYPYGMGEEQ